MSGEKSFCAEECRWRALLLQHERVTDFYLSSWQRGRSAVPLLVVRVLVAALALAVALSSLGTYITHGNTGYWFIYLTHWGVSLNAVTACLAIAVSTRYHLYEPLPSEEDEGLPWFVQVFWVLLNIVTPLSFLITIFYWSLLYNGGVDEEYNLALDVAVHALNSLTTLLLLLSGAHPVRLLHVYQPVAFVMLYSLFNVCYYLAGGVTQDGDRYIYPNIRWSEPGRAVLMSVLTAALLALCHALAAALARARDALADCLPRGPEQVVVE